MLNFALDNLDIRNRDHLNTAFEGANVVVTGGASFIGSHLVDALLELGANVLVLDNFTSGKKENLGTHSKLRVVAADLENLYTARGQIDSSMDYVFHLAAVHGGRGFIESKQPEMMENFALDFNVFSSAAKAKVKSIVNTSSACAYPVGLQHSETSRMLLEETSANFLQPEKSFPDGAYGWTKLMGEYQLATICSRGSQTKGRSARVFTAYGERENESHAAIALVAKSMLELDPFPIWGSGQQTRNFTYVSDTITGLMLMATDASDLQFDVFNVGTQEHVTVFDLVKEIHRQLSFEPSNYEFQTDKPAGVGSRAASNFKIQDTFGWQPTVDVAVGIKRTIEWYLAYPGRVTSVSELDEKLNAR